MEGSGVEILRDSKHGPAFVVNLQKFYEEKTLCDVVLTSSDGVDLEAHWLVLSSHSDFLRHLAVNRDVMQFTMTDSGSLKLNIEAPILKTVVDYLYSGDLVVTRQSIDKIKKAAKCLQLARVLEMLGQSHLSSQTSPFQAHPHQVSAPPKPTFAPQTKTSPYKQSQNLDSTCQRPDQTISSPPGDRVYLPVPESPVKQRNASGASREGSSELKQPSSDHRIQTPVRSRDTWEPEILSASSLFGDKSWEDSSNQADLETSRELAPVENHPEKVKQSDHQKHSDTNCTIQFDSDFSLEDITDHVVCPSSPRLVHDFKMQSIIVDTLTVSRKRGRSSASMSVPSEVRTFEQVPEYLGGTTGEGVPHTVTGSTQGVCEGNNEPAEPPHGDYDDDDVYVEINSSSNDSCDLDDKETQGQEQTENQDTKRRRFGMNHSQFTSSGSNQIAKNVRQKYSDLRLAQGSLESSRGLATKLVKCILCNKPYKTFSRLKAHYSLKHKNVTTLVKELHYRYASARSARPIQRQNLRHGSVGEGTLRSRRQNSDPGTESLVNTMTNLRSERHVNESRNEVRQDHHQTQQESLTVGAVTRNENSSQQPVLDNGEPLNTVPTSKDLDSSLKVTFVSKVKKKRRKKRFFLSKPKNYAWRNRQKTLAAAGTADTGPSTAIYEVPACGALVSDPLDNQYTQDSFQETYSSPQHFIINSSITEDVQPQKNTFKCHICGNPYQSRSALVRHIADKHRRSSHSTLLYKKKRPSFKKRKTFITIKPDPRTGRYLVPGGLPKIIYLKGKPSCPICKKSFTQKFTVNRHMRDIHFKIRRNENTRRKMNLPVSSSDQGPVYSEEQNDVRGPDEEEVEDGINGDMEDKIFVPQSSDSEQDPNHRVMNNVRMSFKRPQSLGFRSRDKQIPSNDDVRQQFELPREAVTCNVCEKSFSHHNTLLQHVRGFHMNLNNYTCVCGKGFIWSSGHSTHKKVCPVYNQRNSLP